MSGETNLTRKWPAAFTWLVWCLMMGILLLGLLRLFWVSEEDGTASAEEASTWAECLPSVAIPANTNISLVSLDGDALAHPDLGNARNPKISYVATGGVVADPISQQLNAELNAVGSATIPKERELRVDKGEFWLVGNVEARLENGERVIIREPDRLRMGPADGNSYVIELTKDVPMETAQKSDRVLPAGAEGIFKLANNKGVTFKTLEATSGKPFLYNTTSKIVPVRAFGDKGPAAVSIEVAGANFGSDNLAACVIMGNKWYLASVTNASRNQSGITDVIVSLPTLVLPEWGWPARIQIALASPDGKFVAHGAFEAYPRLWGAIIATALTIALFGAILKTRYVTTSRFVANEGTDWSRWFAGLFLADGEKDPSLSLFQVFFWTVITVWGLFYTFAVTGSLLQMTPQMMTLLGIAGTGSVLARWIGVSRGEASEQVISTTQSSFSEPFRFWDILNTRGQFDLMKLQLLVYTLLLGVYVVCRIAESGAFPVLDTNTLLLLGISQGVYIGGKLGGTAPLAKAQALQLEIELNTQLTTKLPGDIKSAETTRGEEKSKLDAKIKEKTDMEAQGTKPTEALLKEIVGLENSIKQWDAVIEETKKVLQQASTKIPELKASLEKVIKEELKLQGS